jgi:hypothetical protein
MAWKFEKGLNGLAKAASYFLLIFSLYLEEFQFSVLDTKVFRSDQESSSMNLKLKFLIAFASYLLEPSLINHSIRQV